MVGSKKALSPILVVLLLKLMSHGDDVHRLQQPLPLLVVQVTDRLITSYIEMITIIMMMMMMMMMMAMMMMMIIIMILIIVIMVILIMIIMVLIMIIIAIMITIYLYKK